MLIAKSLIIHTYMYVHVYMYNVKTTYTVHTCMNECRHTRIHMHINTPKPTRTHLEPLPESEIDHLVGGPLVIPGTHLVNVGRRPVSQHIGIIILFIDKYIQSTCVKYMHKCVKFWRLQKPELVTASIPTECQYADLVSVILSISLASRPTKVTEASRGGKRGMGMCVDW